MHEPEPTPLDAETLALHGGAAQSHGPARPLRAPIDPSAAWALPGLDVVDGLYEETLEGYFYASRGGPNTTELGSRIAAMEGAAAGTVSSAGMSALLALFMATLESGDHVILAEDLYGGTLDLFSKPLARFGVKHDCVDPRDIEAVTAAVTPRTRWLVVESISNPLTRVTPLAPLRELADARGFRVLCDNTFATPLLIRPLEHGAHVVMHSVGKFLGGHHDLLAGAIVGDEALVTAVAHEIARGGMALSPWSAWLATRGIESLAPRMTRICMSTLVIAGQLAENRHIKAVWYCGLPEHPDFDVAQRLLPRGMGGIFSVEIEGGRDRVHRFIKALRLVCFVPSLGGTVTTVSHPATTSHRAIGVAARDGLGITNGMLRFSIGVEAPKDLLADIEQALEASEE